MDAPKQEALRLVSRPPDEVPSPQEQGSDPVLPPSSLSRWLEMLMVYPRTNKQNQKKKRKVEPPTPQVGKVVSFQ